MKIIREKDRKSDCKFFLDGESGVLLDFSKPKNMMASAVNYLCDHVTSLEEENDAYYLDDYKYLDKEEMRRYVEDTFDEIRNGVIKGHIYLCSEYHGNYQDISQTYTEMLEKIKSKNYQIIGIPIEQYIDSTKNKDNENEYVIKVMIPIKMDLYCYATANGKMNLCDENTFQEYKDEYRNWLSLLWDEKEVTDSKRQGPSYVDPDMLDDDRKKRINPLFYERLCDFMNYQAHQYTDTSNDKYTYDPEDPYITGEFANENESFMLGFVSDQFGFSAPSKAMDHPYGVYLKKCKMEDKDKEESIDKVIHWVMTSRTIGGSFLWPEDIWGSYNKTRGRKPIQDRVDFTLIEIKHYLEQRKNVVGDLLNVKDDWNGKKWLMKFSSFKDYVDYFCLNPFVDETNDYMPYDIVYSNMEHDKFACVNDDELIEIKKDKKKFSQYNKENSILNLDSTDLEKMFDNVCSMIEERSLMIIDKLNAKE